MKRPAASKITSEYLLADTKTRVIALIVEQFRQPQRFLALARRARLAGKAIVLLHPGRSRAARDSAATQARRSNGRAITPVMRTCRLERQARQS